MMRADALNLHGYPVITETTALSSRIFSTDEGKSEGIIVHETLSQSFFTNEEKSKGYYCQRNFIADLFHGRGQIMF